MDEYPIHYPDRPDIPYDPTPPTDYYNRQRSVRRLAEAGHRRGAPVKQLPVYRMKKEPQDIIA